MLWCAFPCSCEGGGITGLMLKDMSEYLLQAIKSHRSLFLIGRP